MNLPIIHMSDNKTFDNNEYLVAGLKLSAPMIGLLVASTI